MSSPSPVPPTRSPTAMPVAPAPVAAAPVSAALAGRTLLERYQPWRRWVEPGFWIVLMAIQFAVNSGIAIIDVRRAQADFPAWKPVSWELSSHLVVLALVPLLIAFERRVPLTFATFRRNLPWHVLGTVVFCVVHVAAMVGLRKLAYGGMGESYDFGDWPRG